MKTFLRSPWRVALLLVALAAVALGVTNVQLSFIPQAFMGGAWIGSTAAKTSTNKMTNAVAFSTTYQFPALAGATCEDTPNITATGAAAGDPCFVGVNFVQAMTAGAGGGAGVNSGDGGLLNLECFTVAANTVRIRLCNNSATTEWLSDAGYNGWVLSNQ